MALYVMMVGGRQSGRMLALEQRAAILRGLGHRVLVVSASKTDHGPRTTKTAPRPKPRGGDVFDWPG